LPGSGESVKNPATTDFVYQEIIMSKGMNQKREQKKKPAKTFEEKRAEKRAKKTGRSSMPSL
jgi:hypothetical protein